MWAKKQTEPSFSGEKTKNLRSRVFLAALLDCGFHVVLNARSLTKYMLDRDEDAPVANLKDDWQPPPSTLPEVRQYRKHLVQHITALPFGVASASQAGASTCTERSFSK
jgi:hypothetical protein